MTLKPSQAKKTEMRYMSKHRAAILNLSAEGYGIVRKIKDVAYTIKGQVVSKKYLSLILNDLNIPEAV